MEAVGHFRDETRKLHQQRVSIILLAGMALLLLSGLLDAVLALADLTVLLPWRLAAMACCALLLLANRMDSNQHWSWLIGLTGYLVIGITVLLALPYQGSITSSSYVGLVVVMTLYTALAPLTVGQTLLGGFFLPGLYAASAWLAAPLTDGQAMDLFNNLFFMTCFVLIAATQSWADTAVRRREWSLRSAQSAATESLKRQAETLEQEVRRRTVAQQALELHHQILYEAIADDLVLIEPQGTIIQANHSFQSHFSPQNQQVAPSLYDAVHADDRQTLRTAVEGLLAKDTPVSQLRLTMVDSRGEPLEVEISGAAVRRRGVTRGIHLVIRDIRVRKRLEQEVIASLGRIRQTENAAILALANLSEYRDITPGRHLERIREYCATLAAELAKRHQFSHIMTPAYIQNLYQGAVLHDIGKVAVPDTILVKTGPLSVLDEEAMRNHTLKGGDVIKAMELEAKDSGSFLSLAKNIAYFHHERWDGRGYPHGLREGEIPLEARIMAVADAYEEWTGAMPPAERFSHAQAVDMVVRSAGHRFDPVVVDAFVIRQHQFDQIRTTLAEPEHCHIRPTE